MRAQNTDTAPSASALFTKAALARKLAIEHCRNAIGGDCTWYHGAWPYLRALGIAKKAGGQADFLENTLRSLAASRHGSRVLISGAADDAMPLVAVSAFRAAGVSVDLTLIDRCQTPLAFSRWSLAEEGVPIATHQSDILDFGGEDPFDVVMTNSFIGFMHPATWPRLFRHWASLLRPGGKLLMTHRLRPDASHDPLGFAPTEAEKFCAAACDAAERQRVSLAIDRAELDSAVREYAMRLATFSLRSVAALADLLESAGFAADHLDSEIFPGAGGVSEVAGPSAANRGDYVRVLATRIR